MRLMPEQPVPGLDLDLAGGGRFSLSAEAPERFTMIVFYRGLHCPICGRYLSELEGLLPEFGKRGVSVILASSDAKDRAEQAKMAWGLPDARLGYGLAIDRAREWGLYVSTSNGKTSAGIEEPAQFNEPGLFLVRPDRRLSWGTTSTMLFARPHFNEVLQSVDFVIAKNYPARGAA